MGLCKRQSLHGRIDYADGTAIGSCVLQALAFRARYSQKITKCSQNHLGLLSKLEKSCDFTVMSHTDRAARS